MIISIFGIYEGYQHSRVSNIQYLTEKLKRSNVKI